MLAHRKFVNNLASKFWIYRFFKRHSDLARRMPENLGHQRRNVSRVQIKQWFTDQIKASELLLPENSSRVFNLDETGFPLAEILGRLKIIASKGIKNVYRIAPDTKTQITVLGCVSRDENYQKLLVIFPGAQPCYNLDHVNPSDNVLGQSINGWVSSFCGCLMTSIHR
ncbi:uncharacterized protein LOC124815197 [Hydra vulgaris]|uniref:uncharacterized protein LOC124815197 n=1 Tax=Hydra vulgaris TaxID=6087 RepID=UPI001F5E5196|nr:uncharacterized protein LOC124815197 [Hydra vulgaris]